MCSRRFAAALALLAATAAAAGPFQPATAGKKLIEYGWDCPNTAYVRQHIRQMEARPFDGVVIQVTSTLEPRLGGTEGTLGWRVFSPRRLERLEWEHALADLQATPFTSFTDNFIQMISMPGIDWFDPEWGAVADNAAVLARIARLGGCVGLMFDPEQYGPQAIWSWSRLTEAQRQQRSREEYVAQVRQRGQELMRAVDREFGGIRILCLFGPALSLGADYELLAPFLEGMACVASAGTQIIDGYEQSYAYRTGAAFAEGRRTMQVDSRRLFAQEAVFDRVLRAGFGLWLDYASGQRGGWFPAEPERNHFRPDTWQTAVHHALAHADEYVWVYSERLNWWDEGSAGPAYEAAQRSARQAPGPRPDLTAPRPEAIGSATRAAGVAGHDDEATFGDLLATRRVRYDFPASGWLFRADPEDQGLAEGWYRADLPAAGWHPIEIRRFWEEQGWDYDGVAWYRTGFQLAAGADRSVLELVVGAADESATVWLNGELLGAFDQGERGWDQRFALDLTGRVMAGRDNQLALRVVDRTGPGGLWKGIKILSLPPDSAQGR